MASEDRIKEVRELLLKAYQEKVTGRVEVNLSQGGIVSLYYTQKTI